MTMKQTTVACLALGLLLGASTIARPAAAQTCNWNPATDYVAEDDVAQHNADIWFNAFQCMDGSSATHGTIGRYYWDKFGFRQDYWDDGFGFENICDYNRPASRALSAIFILQNSHMPAATSWDDRSGPVIHWAYGYSASVYNGLDDLRVGCFKGTSLATTHRGVTDDYITYWLPLFTQENIVGRAPVVFHEALHYGTGMSHNCGPESSLDQYFYTDHIRRTPCTRGQAGCVCAGAHGTSCLRSSVNPNAQNPSVHAWTILWLMSYYFDVNASTNPTMREWAKASAQARVKNRFCTKESVPSWVLNF